MPRPDTGRKLATFRMDPEHMERLKAIRAEETRRMGYELPLSIVVRACLARGIAARAAELGIAAPSAPKGKRRK